MVELLLQNHGSGERGQDGGLGEHGLGELLEEEEALTLWAGRCRDDDSLVGGLPRDASGAWRHGMGVQQSEVTTEGSGSGADLEIGLCQA